MTDMTAGEGVQAMARTLYKADEEHGPIRMNVNFEQLRWHDRLRYEQMARTVIAAGGLAAQGEVMEGLSEVEFRTVHYLRHEAERSFEEIQQAILGCFDRENTEPDYDAFVAQVGEASRVLNAIWHSRATPAQPDTGDALVWLGQALQARGIDTEGAKDHAVAAIIALDHYRAERTGNPLASVASLSPPDTGDVAALRERVAAIIGPMVRSYACNSIFTNDERDAYTQKKVTELIAALSKPNAPGVGS